MADIIPAILPKSYDELEEKLDLVAGATDTVQVDICDGAYVSSRTWPYLKQGEDQIFENIISEESALPHWQDVDFEFDLMVRDARTKIPNFIAAGAARIIVHKESVSAEDLEAIISEYGRMDGGEHPLQVELGIALPNTAQPNDIASYAHRVHFVQIMGINSIGRQGEPFEPRTIECVKALRAAYPELIISVDGGVNLESGRHLVDAGADSLVVGSGIFGGGTVLENLEHFQSL